MCNVGGSTDSIKESVNRSAHKWPQYGQLTYTDPTYGVPMDRQSYKYFSYADYGEGGRGRKPPESPYQERLRRIKADWQTAAKAPQTSSSPSEDLSNEENRNMTDSLRIRKKKAQGMIAPNLKITVTAPGKSGLNIAKG